MEERDRLPLAEGAFGDLPEQLIGRGLLIVGALSDRWGVTELTVGKLVWCELDVIRVPLRNAERPAARWAS
ncbi:hypothetical protein ACFYXF_19430 [Streptomyces sp. NPDC002680]|uniref:hypothetical protein n=1 Tax=Streptomyces sp. NPDC002680 TaxID=3364659 RepID=UPI003699EBC9